MKLRLMLAVLKLYAHRTSAPRQATAVPTLPACIAQHVIDAGIEVECVRTEGVNRASREAWLARAARAGMNARRGGRQLDGKRQDERSAIGMPQTPPLVDEEPDRASMHGLAAKSHALKGQRSQGGSARVDILGIELPSERPDHAMGPAIEWMR